MDDKIKQIIKNTFLYLKNNNLDFTPESYTKVFCAQAKLLNIDFDECNWFHSWVNKFDTSIKKELNNYPIKTKSDFINVVANICHNKAKFNNEETLKILQKALKILYQQNILDIDGNAPLSIINAKLQEILESSSINLENNKKISNIIIPKPQSLLSKEELKATLDRFLKDDFVLICDICCFDKIRLEFGIDALNKLFDAFYKILLDNAIDGEIIGIYDESSIMIIPPKYDLQKATIYADKIKTTINKSAFMYKNQNIDIKIDIEIIKIKDLKF